MAGPFFLPALVHGSAQPDYRLSDARAYFTLSAGSDTITIQEPIGWDAAEWTMERDAVWHGLNFEFSGEEATLRFRETRALAWLEAVYAGQGPQALAYLDWGLADADGQTLALQRLRLNFAKRQLTGGELTLPGERLSLHPDIKSRWDATLSTQQAQALVNDPVTGNPVTIPAPAPVDLTLHSQHIRRTLHLPADTDKHDTDWQSFANTGGSVIQGGNPLAGLTGTRVYHDFYLNLPLSPEKAAPAEVETFTGSLTSVQVEPPAPVLKTKENGTYLLKDITIDLTVDARLQRAGVSISPPKIKTASLQLILSIGQESHVLAKQINFSVNSRFLGPRRITGQLSVERELPAGVEVKLYGLLTINPGRDNWKGTDVRLLVHRTSLTLTANTSAPASTAPAYSIRELLRYGLSCLTGQSNALESAYYSTKNANQPVDGGGAHRLITSGFLLRNFPAKPLQFSLQQLLTGLQAIDAVGMAYRPTPDGEKLVVEPIANFYRDVEIIRLDSHGLLLEETATDYLHPSVKIGYQKFPDDGPQVLDEFNTQQEYILPAHHGTPYNQLSPLIASGYAIEQTRRKQFSQAPTDSTGYDDDLFIIAAHPGTTLPAATAPNLPVRFGLFSLRPALFIRPDGIASVPFLAKGATMRVSGSALNDGLYKIIDQQLSVQRTTRTAGNRRVTGAELLNVYVLDRPVQAETATVRLSPGSAGTYIAERDASFADVRGVLDPATTYNLRLSPRFNFLRHGRYVAGGLIYHNGAELIRCAASKHNGSLVTRLKSNAPGDLNIDVRRLIGHRDSLYVADLREPLDPIWTPERVTVETRLTIDQMLYLRANLQAYHPDPARHYGYVSLTGRDGNEWRLFPLKISYVPATGRCVLTGIKKFVPLSQPSGQRGCSFYAGYTFADFESAGSVIIDAWIESCRFDNFQ